MVTKISSSSITCLGIRLSVSRLKYGTTVFWVLTVWMTDVNLGKKIHIVNTDHDRQYYSFDDNVNSRAIVSICQEMERSTSPSS